MTTWIVFLKELINLFTWMAFAFGLYWKTTDAIVKIFKEKSVGAEALAALKAEIEAIKKDKEHFTKCTEDHASALSELKGMVKEMGSRMWDFLKTK